MVKITLNKISSKKVYVKLNKKLIDYILNLIIKSNTVLEKNVKDNIYRIQKGNKCSLTFIKRLSYMLEIPLKDFEKDISLMTSVKNTNIGIKNPKFPLEFNNENGIRFISSIFGNGEINSQIQVRYNNQDKELVNSVLVSAKKTFGDIDYKIYHRKDNTYQLHFPKIIGLIMLELGLKAGYKSVTNYEIPKFIFKSNKRLKAIFIRQFYDDEGSIRSKDRRLQVKQTLTKNISKEEVKSDPEKYCHNFLKGIKKLLENFGIKPKIYLESYRKEKNSIKIDYSISIYGKENLEKFQKEIGFDLYYKKVNLAKAIKSYKFPSALRNKRIEFALEKYKQTLNKYGQVTPSLLARESNRAIKTVRYYLIDLKKKSLI